MTVEYLGIDAQIELLERLLRGTVKNRFQWNPWQTDYVFSLAAEKYGFTITSRDEDDLAPFVFEIFDTTATPPKKMQVVLSSSDSPAINAPLEDLYFAAKRQALRLDTVAADIFSALDRLEGVGETEG